MVSTSQRFTNYFNIRQSATNQGLYAFFRLGQKVNGSEEVSGSCYLGSDFEEGGARILEVFEAAKLEGVKLEGSRIIMMSVQTYEDLKHKHRVEPLSRKELGKLVVELNKKSNFFTEGGIAVLINGNGKERG